MTDSQTRYVAFDGRQVAVSTNIPEVLGAVEQSFRRMLEPHKAGVVGHLEVCRSPRGYLCRSRRSWLRSQSLGEIVMNLENEIIREFISRRPDLLWLHAGAAALEGRAVLVCGSSGRGKSTIIAALCRLGWHFLSDDVTPLDPHSTKVFPFPLTPMYRPHPGEEVPPDHLGKLPKVEAPIHPDALCREAVPVTALLFPSYTPGQRNELIHYPPSSAALDLLQNCLNVVIHREAAFDHLTQLARRSRAYRLSFSSGSAAGPILAQARAAGAF